MRFSELPQARKASIAEAIVDKHIIEKKRLIPYRPVWENVAHPFDRLIASLDKRTLLISDTKAKSARTYYPDTGIDTKHWHTYRAAFSRYNLDTYLVFVDERAKKIYGQLLSILEQPRVIEHICDELRYPLIEKYKSGTEIIYFPLVAMEDIADISSEDVLALEQFSTRNPAYDRIGGGDLTPSDDSFI